MSRSQSSKTFFSLPPLISLEKKQRLGGISYVFRHEKFGELGSILVQGIKENATHFGVYVSGDIEDPMTAKRRAIFEPLANKTIEYVEKMLGPRPDPGLVLVPQRPPDEKIDVPSKLFQCERCDKLVAMLVFAEDANTSGHFEDYARLMYAECIKLNVPTWIIGPLLGSGPFEKRSAKTLQIWPERQTSTILLSPQEFDKKNLDPLIKNHCKSP